MRKDNDFIIHKNEEFCDVALFYGKSIKLRSVELSDVDFLVQNMNNIEIRRTMGSILPMTKQQEEEWVRATWKQRMEGTRHAFAVTTMNGEMVGTSSLFRISKLHQKAELGIGIYPASNQNKGYGTDAVITTCGFGFLHMNMNQIHLWFLEDNKNGQKVYEKAGFRNLARERDGMYRDGKFHDLLRMDILKSEWMEKFPEYTLRAPKTSN